MTRFLNSKYSKISLVVFYFAVILVMCRYAKKNSYYDLDIVFYSACAIEPEHSSVSDLHQSAYAMALHDMGEEKFRQYTDSAKYFRNSVYRSAENFYSQLPFYRVKPLYIGLLRLGIKLGFSPFYFSTYINLCCYLFIAVILLFYLIKHLNFIRGYTVSVCVMLFPTLLDATKNNTPDMLAAFFGFTAILLFLSNKTRYLSVLPFCLLVLTRPENVIFVGALCLVCFLLKPENYPRKFVLLLFALCISCYAWTRIVYPGHAWSVLYQHTCLGFIPNPDTMSHPLTIKEYLLGLRFLVNSVFYSEFFVVLLLVIYPLISIPNTKHILFLTAYALLISFAIRICLLPDLSPRFFTGPLLIAVVLFFRLMSPKPDAKTAP